MDNENKKSLWRLKNIQFERAVDRCYFTIMQYINSTRHTADVTNENELQMVVRHVLEDLGETNSHYIFETNNK